MKKVKEGKGEKMMFNNRSNWDQKSRLAGIWLKMLNLRIIITPYTYNARF